MEEDRHSSWDHANRVPVVTEQDFAATVIDRLARIEVGVTGLNDKFDGLAKKQETHTDELTDIKSRLAVIESSKGTGLKVLGAVASVLGASAIVLTILDRIYQ